MNLLLPFLLSFANRLRGGGFIHTGSTQLARCLWAAAFTGAAALVTPITWWVAAATFISCFLGLIISGHASHQDMGRMSSDYTVDKQSHETLTYFLPVYTMEDPLWYREFIDFMGMTVIGFARTALAILPLVWLHPEYLIMLLIGLTQGIAYLLAWQIPHDNKVKWFSNPEGSVHNAEYGELLWGLFIGLGFVLVGVIHG